MYGKQYPDKNDLVIIQIKDKKDYGVHAELLEYPIINDGTYLTGINYDAQRKIEGLITELPKRKLHSNNIEVARVLYVDKSKSYIDLSLNRITDGEKLITLEKWQKSNFVYDIMKSVSLESGEPLSKLIDTFCKPLYEKYVHADDIFREIRYAHKDIDELKLLSESTRKILYEKLNYYLPDEKIKISAVLSLISIIGIDDVKFALNKGKELYPHIMIRSISSPDYLLEIFCDAIDKDKYIKIMNNAIEYIKDNFRGTMTIIKKPD